MLALMGALADEISGLKSHMVIEETITHDGGYIYKGKYGDKPALLIQGGIGKGRVEGMAQFILGMFKPNAFISLGFAGALTAGAKAGDIVLCSSLECNGGEPCRSDAGLIQQSLRAVDRKVSLRQGRAVAVDRAARTPELKEKLGRNSGADIVEMESYWIARVVSGKVPFLAVRAVSDRVRDSLPPFERFMSSNGDLRLGKAIVFYLAHPRYMAGAIRLYRNTKKARANLTYFIDCLASEL